jgi:hypothetical protein
VSEKFTTEEYIQAGYVPAGYEMPVPFGFGSTTAVNKYFHFATLIREFGYPKALEDRFVAWASRVWPKIDWVAAVSAGSIKTGIGISFTSQITESQIQAGGLKVSGYVQQTETLKLIRCYLLINGHIQIQNVDPKKCEFILPTNLQAGTYQLQMVAESTTGVTFTVGSRSFQVIATPVAAPVAPLAL